MPLDTAAFPSSSKSSAPTAVYEPQSNSSSILPPSYYSDHLKFISPYIPQEIFKKVLHEAKYNNPLPSQYSRLEDMKLIKKEHTSEDANFAEQSFASADTVPSPYRDTNSEYDTVVDKEEYISVKLADGLKHMAIDKESRFFGKSSGMMLVRDAMNVKDQYAKNERSGTGATSVPDKEEIRRNGGLYVSEQGAPWQKAHLQIKREEFWERLPVSVVFPSSLAFF